MANARHAEDGKTKVFVSYSRKDRDSIRRLTTALEADGEIDVLLDTEDILPTEEWRARLEGLIAQADTVVFCLTPRSAASEVCAWEVATSERLNKRIAPVVIEEVNGQLPGGLAKLNYIFFTGRDDFDSALVKLRDALEADIDWIREHTRIGELAQRWDADGRRRPDLLRGPALGAAEAWLIDQPAKAGRLRRFGFKGRSIMWGRELVGCLYSTKGVCWRSAHACKRGLALAPST
jgi:TIR domain